MTTIAVDGKSVAGDGMVTSGTTVCNTDFCKVHRLSDGRIAGIAGSAFNVIPFVEWLENGGDCPELSEGFDALVLHPDGKCWAYNEKGRFIPEPAPTAVGSGREIAIGAMLAGASAREAVAIAATRDNGTGGAIVEERL